MKPLVACSYCEGDCSPQAAKTGDDNEREATKTGASAQKLVHIENIDR